MNDLQIPPLTAAMIASSRGRETRRRHTLVALMLVLLALGFLLTLMAGQSFTPFDEVIRVLAGESVPGADFTVGQLRLPRAVLAIGAGISFGLGGAAFQTMLRNPLASPDIIGITSGASAAAVFAIVILSLNGPAVSVIAVGAGLAVALLVYGLSAKNGVAGARLILIGIGVSAMLESMIAYTLSRAPAFTLQEAMRWLTGSLNGAKLEQSLPVMASLLVFGALILSKARLIVVISAVGLIATATAVTGPIAFVAFLAGPIATGMVGRRRSILLPAGLFGALLVLIGDFVGQFLLPGRYPVGVVTGALGAPYLIALIIRNNRRGGTP